MPKKIEIKRADAAAMIDKIRLALAKEIAEERETPFVDDLVEILTEAGISVPDECSGQAHDPEVGGHIDNCGVCLNGLSYGWTGKPLKIR